MIIIYVFMYMTLYMLIYTIPTALLVDLSKLELKKSNLSWIKEHEL